MAPGACIPLILHAAALWSFCAAAGIWVAPQGEDSLTCGTEGAPCATFAAAVALSQTYSSNHSVSIYAAPGTYGEDSCNASVTGPLTVIGAGSGVTIIDCAYSARAFYVSECVDFTLIGITVLHGAAEDYGGGVFLDWSVAAGAVASPRAVFVDVAFVNCSVAGGNHSDAGGGGLAITLNRRVSAPGVFRNPVVHVDNCSFTDNVVATQFALARGGGMLWGMFRGEAHSVVVVVSRCLVTGNAAYAEASGNMCILLSCAPPGYWTIPCVCACAVSEGGGLAFALDGDMEGTAIDVQNCSFLYNGASYGGGLYVEHDGNRFAAGAISLTNSVVEYNAADQDGAGIFVEYFANFPYDAYVSVSSCNISHNVAGGNGAGLFVFGVAPARLDVQNDVTFRAFVQFSHVNVTSCRLHNNSAHGIGSCGGGIAFVSGGDTNLVDCDIQHNYATLFGGGLYVGPVGVSLTTSGNVTFAANRAALAPGGQIAMLDGGDIVWRGLHVSLALNASEVLLMHSGAVSVADSSFSCPSGSLFLDSANGMYGKHAVRTSESGSYVSILVSNLEFGCEPCPPGMYVIEAGMSTGEPQVADNPVCALCPYGGACGDGTSITATPGYWGALVQAGSTPAGRMTHGVEFTSCPPGYCCSSASGGLAPCKGIDTCAGARTGRLCGACAEGHSEVFASAICRGDDACDDGAWFWAAYLVGVLLEGCFLLVVSEVWWPRRNRDPNNKIRLVSYFYQMVPSIRESATISFATPAWRQELDATQTVMRFQFPEAMVKRGACAIPGMSTQLKLSFGYINPVLVACAMALCYLVGEWLMRRRLCRRAVSRLTRCLPVKTAQEESLRPASRVRTAVAPQDTDVQSPCEEYPLGQQAPSPRADHSFPQVELTVTTVHALPAGLAAQGAHWEVKDAHSVHDSAVDAADAEYSDFRGASSSGARSVRVSGEVVAPHSRAFATRGQGVLGGDSFPAEYQFTEDTLPVSSVASTCSRQPLRHAPVVNRSLDNEPACIDPDAAPPVEAWMADTPGLTTVSSPSDTPYVLSTQRPVWWQKCLGAGITWLLFAYSPLLSTTLTFLTCVSVPGSPDTYLYKNATQQCTAEWIAPLAIMTAVLVGFAVALPWLASHVRQGHKGHTTATHRALCGSFQPQYYWWETVLVAHRLFMSFLDTFMSQYPIIHLASAAIVCLLCTVAHITLAPMAHNSTQRLQTCLLVSLTVVVLTLLPQAQSLEEAAPGLTSVSYVSKQSGSVMQALQVIFLYIAPACSLLLFAPKSAWYPPFATKFT